MGVVNPGAGLDPVNSVGSNNTWSEHTGTITLIVQSEHYMIGQGPVLAIFILILIIGHNKDNCTVKVNVS